MTETKEIKKWLVDHEHTLKWLWRLVRPRGFLKLQYNHFTEIMNCSYVGGYASSVIATARQVINEQKEEQAYESGSAAG